MESLDKNLADEPKVQFEYEGESEMDENFRQLLGENYDTLNDILIEMQRKSGVEEPKDIPKIIEFYEMEPVKVEKGLESTAGQYDDEQPDRIFMNAHGWDAEMKVFEGMLYSRQLAKEKGLGSSVAPIHPLAKKLRTAIHEYLHAISLQRRTVLEDGSSRDEVGFRLRHKKADSEESTGMHLNEAMTEHLSQVVLDEMVYRAGLEHELGFDGKMSVLDSHELRNSAYTEARKQLFGFVEVASTILGVTEELVWQALTRQYFSGELSFDEFAGFMHGVSELDPEYLPEQEEYVTLSTSNRRSVLINYLNKVLFESLEFTGYEYDHNLEAKNRFITSLALKMNQTGKPKG